MVPLDGVGWGAPHLLWVMPAPGLVYTATLAPWAPECESRGEATPVPTPNQTQFSLFGVTVKERVVKNSTKMSTKTIKWARHPVPFPFNPLRPSLLTSKLYWDRISYLRVSMMKSSSPEWWPRMGALTTQSPASTHLRMRRPEGATPGL